MHMTRMIAEGSGTMCCQAPITILFPYTKQW